MKNYSILKILAAFLMLLLLGIQIGCSDDPTTNETESAKNLQLMVGDVWSVQNVSVDDIDQTDLYKDLKITFTASSYTATDGGSIWPASGTWKFVDDSGKTIERGDGVMITLIEVIPSKLVLAFDWAETTLSGGRRNSLSGNHVFTFER